MLDTLRQDLRFALRQLRRSPGFALAAILTLALGIGANTALFSVAHEVLLRPLPYAGAGRLLELRERNGPQDTHGMVVTFGNFAAWQERSRSFESFAAWGYGAFTLTGTGEPRRLQALAVNADYFKTLYIQPSAGRYFAPRDADPGEPHVVVLSHSLWESQFGGDPSVVGRTITLSGAPYTVVGVAAPAYALSDRPNLVYVPLVFGPSERAEHGDHELAVVGKVRTGVTATAAVRELTRIETRLARQYPDGGFDGHIVARPMRDMVVGTVRDQILILFGAVGLVLLIACANLTNLLLARGVARRSELAIRGALGADRGRLVSQMLAESLVLGLAGSAVGLAVAWAGVRFFVARAPAGVPRLEGASVDGTVVAFAVGLALVSSLLFGLLPALRAARVEPQGTLRESSRSGTGVVSARLRSVLVIAQVSVALVLLASAGLLLRSGILLGRVSPGFDPHDVLAAATELPASRYPSAAEVRSAFERIHDAVAAIPGVASAALVSRIPIGAFGYDCGAREEGSRRGVDANLRVATGDFFSTLGIPLLRGRTFGPGDVADAPGVVVINSDLAHRLFGDADPLGRRLTHCDGDRAYTVIGVTADTHANGLDREVADEVYYPEGQRSQRSQYLVVRGSVPAMGLALQVRRAVASVDPLLALTAPRTMDEIIRRSTATRRFNTTLLTLLGVIGLVLAAIGIYGVIAFLAAQRTHEIGIRIALGADRRRVVRLVVGQGLAVGALGVAIGIAVALPTTRALASLLYGVRPGDPAILGAAGMTLLAVAGLAAWLPARRAARTDPMDALRHE